MKYLKDIRISGFRGLKDICLESCGDVNLLVGENNSGKTSVLEAIYLLGAPTSVERWHQVQQIRSSWPMSDSFARYKDTTPPIEWYFPRDEEQTNHINVSANLGGELFARKETLQASVERIVGSPPESSIQTENEFEEGVFRRAQEAESNEVPGLRITIHKETAPYIITIWEEGRRSYQKTTECFNVEVVNSLGHRSDAHLLRYVSSLVKSNKKSEAEALYKGIDPRAKRLEIADPLDVKSRRMSLATVVVEMDGVGFVPIQALGDGMRRALLLSAVVSNMERGGVILIDEIEVGMHVSVLKDVLGWLISSCKKAGIQMFMTTHSVEAIDAIIETVHDSELVLFRLEEPGVKRIDGALLRASRADFGYEVR